MKKSLSPIIQAEELLKLYKTSNLILVDASSGENAQTNYEQKHLDGAIYVDLNTHLAEIEDDFSQGGRHPLPSVERFLETVANLGISPEDHVVIYDDKNGSNAAARFWWMLTSIGMEKVQVLNGGLTDAERIGFPTSSDPVFIETETSFDAKNWKLPLSSISEVEQASQNSTHVIIDVRSPERFNGESEPIDLVAGHIPNAINIPFTQNLDEKGYFLSPTALQKKYHSIFEQKNSSDVIVHCGSGVTACHTLLAISYAGFDIPKLYVGSWSEWSRNEKPIAKNI